MKNIISKLFDYSKKRNEKNKCNNYCPLKKGDIDDWSCYEITSELEGVKTEEKLTTLQTSLNITKNEIQSTCFKCPNYDSYEQDDNYVFNNYCPIKNEKVKYWDCIRIQAELDGWKVEEDLIGIRNELKKTNDEIEEICEGCPNF